MTKFIVAIALLATACGKGDKDKDKLAAACTTGSEALKRDASSASAEDFKSILSSTLLACSKACDASDDPSCKKLDVNLETTCKGLPDFCVSICGTAQSASLKSTACRLAKAKS